MKQLLRAVIKYTGPPLSGHATHLIAMQSFTWHGNVTLRLIRYIFFFSMRSSSYLVPLVHCPVGAQLMLIPLLMMASYWGHYIGVLTVIDFFLQVVGLSEDNAYLLSLSCL